MVWRDLLNALSVPYKEPGEGFWGPKTVTLNFCEEVHQCGGPMSQLAILANLIMRRRTT